jgi:hypothetical protein
MEMLVSWHLAAAVPKWPTRQSELLAAVVHLLFDFLLGPLLLGLLLLLLAPFQGIFPTTAIGIPSLKEYRRLRCGAEGFSVADIERKTDVKARSQRNIRQRAKERGFDLVTSPRILDHYVVDGKSTERPPEISAHQHWTLEQWKDVIFGDETADTVEAQFGFGVHLGKG